MTKGILFQAVLGTGFALGLGACTHATQDMQTSHSIPAAVGLVKASEGKNGNTDVSVQVEHLARPGAVESDSNTYVVWVKDGGSGHLANLGALHVDKNLKGELKTVTPYKNFDLFVTPESESAAVEPSGERLLWTHVSVQ